MTTTQPELQTQRLVLRPFSVADADDVERLAGDFKVAEPTATIPHPYPKGAATEWIATHHAAFVNRERVVFAITDRDSSQLVGAINLIDISEVHARCEIGYWVSHAQWSQGIGSEATGAVIEYARSVFGVTRVTARCLARNVGSARVMEKAGLVLEGRLAKHDFHRGAFEDMLLYGVVFSVR